MAMPVLLVLSAPSSAAADAAHPGEAGPHAADLRSYAVCSKTAETRVLSFAEAAACARTFMRIKLSFVPGVGLDEFDALSPQEKAAVNRAGYDRYLEWSEANAPMLEALADESPSSPEVAAE